MPSERPWSDADRELVERAWRSTSGVRLDGIEMMISDAMRAADVLDALTAAGWRPTAPTAREIAVATEGAAHAVHALIREHIAEEIAADFDARRTTSTGIPPVAAAAIARAHRTTPTGEPTDA